MSITKHIIEHIILGLPIDASSSGQLTAEEIRILTGRQGVVSANSLHNHSDVSSHFGTTDGTTNGYMSFSSTNAYIADSNGTYDIHGWSGSLKGTIKGTKTYTTNGLVTDLNIGDSISVQLLSTSNAVIYSSSLSISSYNQSNGVISLLDHGLKTNGKNEGRVSISINFTTAHSSGGYCKIVVNHNCSTTGIIYSQTYETFVDNGTTPPNISDMSLNIVTPYYRYLSGVKYYTSGTVANISCTIPNIANQSYVNTPLTINASEYGIGQFDVTYNDSSVSGLSSPPKYNETFVYNKNHAIVAENFVCSSARLYGISKDQFGVAPTFETTPENILINTAFDESTSVAEYFSDELYRLANSDLTINYAHYVGTFSSMQLQDGYAQLFDGKLIVPHTNYTTGYSPSQSNDVNFSTYVGISRRFEHLGEVDYEDTRGWYSYARSFFSNGTPKTKATIDVGLSKTQLDEYLNNGDLYIFIKLEGQTGWLSFNKRYDFGEFTGADNDGCRYDGGDYWQAVFGNFSTAASCYTIRVEIWIKNTSPELTKFVITDWEPAVIHPCYSEEPAT